MEPATCYANQKRREPRWAGGQASAGTEPNGLLQDFERGQISSSRLASGGIHQITLASDGSVRSDSVAGGGGPLRRISPREFPHREAHRYDNHHVPTDDPCRSPVNRAARTFSDQPTAGSAAPGVPLHRQLTAPNKEDRAAIPRPSRRHR
jgi:hypothetical protein